MPMRDGGGDVVFGVRITADSQVFVNGVKASREELDRFADSLQKMGPEAEKVTRSHENMTGAVVKGTTATEVMTRAWDEAVNTFRKVVQVTTEAQATQSRLEAVLRATRGA